MDEWSLQALRFVLSKHPQTLRQTRRHSDQQTLSISLQATAVVGQKIDIPSTLVAFLYTTDILRKRSPCSSLTYPQFSRKYSR